MLFTRWKRAKSKKGITLVEMIAAIAITAILASVLSMMVVPVMNAYRTSSTKADLQLAVTGRLNDIAMWLRSATGVYVTMNPGSFPETSKNNLYQYQAVSALWGFDIKWGFANMNCYDTSGYNYPELKWVEYAANDTKNHSLKWASAHDPSMKLASDVYQTPDFSCPTSKDFYFYVRKNPDNDDHSNVLEVHLKVQQGNVTYEGSKTIVCENLVITGKDIYKARFDKDSKTGKWKDLEKADVSTGSDQSKWVKYYSVWFSREI